MALPAWVALTILVIGGEVCSIVVVRYFWLNVDFIVYMRRAVATEFVSYDCSSKGN